MFTGEGHLALCKVTRIQSDNVRTAFLALRLNSISSSSDTRTLMYLVLIWLGTKGVKLQSAFRHRAFPLVQLAEHTGWNPPLFYLQLHTSL